MGVVLDHALAMGPSPSATPASPASTQAGEPVRAQLEAIARGDEAAFASLYEAWLDHVVSAVRAGVGRDESFHLDVAHDVFMTLIRRTPRATTPGELGAWLKVTAKRRALDLIRAERRRTERELRRGGGPGEADSDARAERLAWLDEQIAALSDEQADLLIARHRFGWTLERVGRAFGISPGAADGRLNRITNRLRHKAQEHDHE